MLFILEFLYMRWFIICSVFLMTIAFSSLFVFAGNATVKVIPKNGEPMILQKFGGMPSTFDTIWNQQALRIDSRRISSIKVIKVFTGSQNPIEAQITLDNGEAPVLPIDDFLCYGETKYGEISIRLSEMVLLELSPELDKAPQASETNLTH